MSNRVYTFEDLRNEQVLWAINRHVFHPRGFALAVAYPEGSDKEAIQRGEVEPIGWRLIGDGKEPWLYVDRQLEEFFNGKWKPGVVPVDENESFRVFEALLARHRGASDVATD